MLGSRWIYGLRLLVILLKILDTYAPGTSGRACKEVLSSVNEYQLRKHLNTSQAGCQSLVISPIGQF